MLYGVNVFVGTKNKIKVDILDESLYKVIVIRRKYQYDKRKNYLY